MRFCEKLNTVSGAALLLSLCTIAAHAAPATTAADAPASAPDSANQTGTGSTTVTITAPRPRTKTPGVFSLDGLSLASPLSQADAPSQPAMPSSYFGGGGGMPHKLLLGSAPTPTPDDLCVYGSDAVRCFTDSSRQERRHFIADPHLPGHFREVRPGDDKIVEQQILAEKLARQHMFWLEK
jgi:hypothetical protein